MTTTPQSFRFLNIICESSQEEVQSGRWILRFLPSIPEMPTDVDYNRAKYTALQCMWHVGVEATMVLMTEPKTINVPTPARVFGDVWGQWTQLIRWLKVDNPDPLDLDRTGFHYVFTGNIGCKGPDGVVCAFTLLALKVKYPTRIFLMKGVQEDEMNLALPRYTPTIFEGLMQFQLEPSTVQMMEQESDEEIAVLVEYRNAFFNTPQSARRFIESVYVPSTKRIPEIKKGMDRYNWAVFERVCVACSLFADRIIIGEHILVGSIPDAELIQLLRATMADLVNIRTRQSIYFPSSYTLPDITTEHTTLDTLRWIDQTPKIQTPVFQQPDLNDLFIAQDLTVENIGMDSDPNETDDKDTHFYQDLLTPEESVSRNDIDSMRIPERSKEDLYFFLCKLDSLNRMIERVKLQCMWNRPLSENPQIHQDILTRYARKAATGFVPQRHYLGNFTVFYTSLGAQNFLSENNLRFIIHPYHFEPSPACFIPGLMPTMRTGMPRCWTRASSDPIYSDTTAYDVGASSLWILRMDSQDPTRVQRIDTNFL